MTLSIAKVEGIHTLVVSLTGVILGLLLGWGYLNLERQQLLSIDYQVSLSDLTRLQDSIQQWLLMGDLVYGSGETYLIEGAGSQGQLALSISEQLQQSALAETSRDELEQIGRLLLSNQQRLNTAATVSPENESVLATELLVAWDNDAGDAVRLLQSAKSKMSARSDESNAFVISYRANLHTLSLLAALFYIALVLYMWRWVNESLVKPIVSLTRATDEALANDTRLALADSGPTEVKSLTQSARALIEDLEERVTQRTCELQRREDALQQEVETRREAEQAAAAAQQLAEAANEAKSQFLANMSHEIRTPLNGVLGGADLALQTAEGEEQRNTLEVIINSGKQLLGVINDILDFSKSDAGQLELKQEEFDVVELLSDAINLFAPVATDKKLELILAMDPRIARSAIGDRLRVGQILNNLIGNAVKFADAGEIVVRATLEDAGADTPSLRFEVEDSGQGISADQQQLIFEPFRQADGSSTRKWSGTGLGLSICKRFVELMGGTIGVNSTIDRGSIFWFKVPFQAGTSSHAELENTCSGKARVLAKSQVLTVYLQELLTFWGFEVISNDSSDITVDVLIAEQELLEAETKAERVVTLCTGAGFSPSTPGSTCLPKPVNYDRLYASLNKTTDSQAAPEKAETIQDHFDMKVLVVEDNPVNQQIVSKSLTILGCEVKVASNGQSGFDAIKQQAFDLVLMDWHMPDMDGLEVTRRTRDWEAKLGGQHTPIFALTANAMEGDAEKCLNAGMDGYLSKPINLGALRNALTQAKPMAASNQRN